MNNPSTKPIKVIVILLITFVVLFVGYEVFSAERFHLINTNPALNNISTSQKTIKLNFNKTLTPKNLIVIASPTNIWSDQVSDKTLVINFSSIDNKPYSITILSLYDTNGSEIKNLVLHFTPIVVSFNQLPNNVQKTIVNGQPNQNQPTSILNLFPYNGSDYELTLQYTSNGGALPEIVYTYVPNTMDNLEGSTAEQTSINNAKVWLASNGISLTTYSLINSTTGQSL